jgi:hypothetical protein
MEAVETGDVLPTGGESNEWEVTSGTGDHEDLQASGTYSGRPMEPGSWTIRVTYTGVVNSE